MCDAAGFKSARTYIASGNVVFKSSLTEAKVKATLEAALAAFGGKPATVLVRTGAEIAAVLANNPFPEMPGNLTHAFFLDKAPPADALQAVSGQANEQLGQLGQLGPGQREIYVFYPDGAGVSKLKIPAAKNGTARNMNTVAKLAEMAAAL
jgi:uncharacterized protein (DUF1697 family)